MTGSFTLICRTFGRNDLKDRWSLMAVVSQDRLHCITIVEPVLNDPTLVQLVLGLQCCFSRQILQY